MKILHIVTDLLRRGGGPSESVPMTAMAQVRAGLEVGIVFFDYGEPSLKALEAERSGVKLYRFRCNRTRLNPTAFSGDLVRRLEDVAKGYDIIQTHAQWLFPIWWGAHVARKLKKPYVMMPRGSFAPERLKHSHWKKALVGWIDRHYVRHAAAVWATAEREADAVKAYVPQAKVDVFPIGLNVEQYEAKARGEGQGKTLLYFSRISPIKGLDMLAEAWSRLRLDAWRLLIVGPDDRGYTEKIKKVFAEKCPTESYEFRGPVYGEEKLRLLASADAFVLPTLNENWGIAVAEAMASALPVVCTKGAPWGCLESERAGWWTEVSAGGLERALRELTALSDEERLAMGARGRNWVEQNLAWPVIARRMKTVYNQIHVLHQ